MTADVGPGTPLICIDGSNPHPRNAAYALQEGGMYFVLRVDDMEPYKTGYPNCPRCGEDARHGHLIVLKEKPWWRYTLCRFRPLSGDDLVREEAAQNPYDVAPPPVFVGIDYATGPDRAAWRWS